MTDYSDTELEAIRQWETDGREEYLSLSNDVPLDLFRFKNFVSRSKGRKDKSKPSDKENRIQRKTDTEVELYTYGNGKGHWTTDPPFDDWATEAYGRDEVDNFGSESLSERLRREIVQRSKLRTK